MWREIHKDREKWKCTGNDLWISRYPVRVTRTVRIGSFYMCFCGYKEENQIKHCLYCLSWYWNYCYMSRFFGERGGSVVECRTPEREVRGSKPTAAVLCP